MSAAVLVRWQRQADEFVPCQSGFLQFCWKSFPSLAHSEPCRVQANQISPLCLYRASTSQAEEKMGLRHLYSGAETVGVSRDWHLLDRYESSTACWFDTICCANHFQQLATDRLVFIGTSQPGKQSATWTCNTDICSFFLADMSLVSLRFFYFLH